MAKKDDKKGLFGKAVDALSSRDEKDKIAALEAELEKAKKEAAAAKESIKDLLDQNVEAKEEKSVVKQAAEKAEEKIEELEAKLKEQQKEEFQRKVQARRDAIEERKEKAEELKKSTLIGTHTVAPGETLSHIALKYYKHATPPYWKYLLEHNNELLKGNERSLQAGMDIEIPELPEDLKD